MHPWKFHVLASDYIRNGNTWTAQAKLDMLTHAKHTLEAAKTWKAYFKNTSPLKGGRQTESWVASHVDNAQLAVKIYWTFGKRVNNPIYFWIL